MNINGDIGFPCFRPIVTFFLNQTLLPLDILTQDMTFLKMYLTILTSELVPAWNCFTLKASLSIVSKHLSFSMNAPCICLTAAILFLLAN